MTVAEKTAIRFAHMDARSAAAEAFVAELIRAGLLVPTPEDADGENNVTRAETHIRLALSFLTQGVEAPTAEAYDADGRLAISQMRHAMEQLGLVRTQVEEAA